MTHRGRRFGFRDFAGLPPVSCQIDVDPGRILAISRITTQGLKNRSLLIYA